MTVNGTTSDQYTKVRMVVDSEYSKRVVTGEPGASYVYARLEFQRNVDASGPLEINGWATWRYRYHGSGGEQIKKVKIDNIPNDGEWHRFGATTFYILHTKEIEMLTFEFYANKAENTFNNLSFSIPARYVYLIPSDDTAEVKEYSVNGNGYITEGIKISYIPSVDSYNKLAVYAGKKSYYFELGQGLENKTYTVNIFFTEDQLKEIYSSNTTSNNVDIRFNLYSYTESDYSGRVEGYVILNTLEGVKFPEDDTTKPTAILEINPESDLDSPLNKLYWPGKTKIHAKITNAEAKYSASIKSQKITIIDEMGEEELTSRIISSTNPITVKATITDTRNITRTLEQVITPVAYGPPQVKPCDGNTGIIVARCDEEGAISDKGELLFIAAMLDYSKYVFEGEPIVKCKLQYSIKEGASEYGEPKVLISEDSQDDSFSGRIEEEIEIEKNYTVKLTAIDNLGNSIDLYYTLSSGQVYMHRSGSRNSIAFGGYISQDNAFEVYNKFILYNSFILVNQENKHYEISVSTSGQLTATLLQKNDKEGT